MNINQAAPAVASQRIEINAPPAVVWELLSAIDQWPSWNPDIKQATLAGELKPGVSFVWKAGPNVITSQLQAVEPLRLIAWTGQTMGIRAVHVWRIEARGAKTIATSEESWDGWLPRLLKAYSTKTLAASTARALALLKAAAEASSANAHSS